MTFIAIIFGFGLGGIIGFDLIMDSYNCYYGVSEFTKEVPDILSILSSEQINKIVKYENYDIWFQTKIECALKMDLSLEAYNLERGFDVIMDVSKNVLDNSKDPFSFINNNVWDNDPVSPLNVNNNVDLLNTNIVEKTELDIKNYIEHSSDEFVDFTSGDTNNVVLDDENDVV